jgi:hypothetical protein
MMILVAVAVVLCVFGLQKEGYHMDEMISFELANARFNPWIVPTQPEGRLAKYVREDIEGDNFGETMGNLSEAAVSLLREGRNSPIFQFNADVYPEPVWIDRLQFHQYITTGSEDRFLYASVYFNVKDDNHPPLYFMLLHTVSSILPGKVFPMMGCMLNMIPILGCCVLLMKLGRILDGHMVPIRHKFSIWNKLLLRNIFPRNHKPESDHHNMFHHRSSIGDGELQESKADDTYVGFYTGTGLLAALMYGLSAGAIAGTLLIRMYAWVTFFCVMTGYYHVRKWKQPEFDPRGRRIITVTVLGFWTQYFFLFYCITLAVVTSVMIWRDRHNLFRKYIFHMLCAAGIGILGFPFAVSDVFSSGRGVEVLDQISSGMIGYGARVLAFGQILLKGCCGDIGRLLIEVPLLMFLVTVACLAGCIALKRTKGSGKVTGVFWMLGLPPVLYFLLAARVSPYLIDRYIMPVYPFAIWGGAVFLMYLFRFMGSRSRYLQLVPGVLLFAAIIWNLFHYDGEYLYQGYERQLEAAIAYREFPCICIYEGYSFYENLTEFDQYETTLLVKPEELANRVETASIMEWDQVVILEKRGVDRIMMEAVLEQKYNLYPTRELIAKGSHGDRLWLWERGG